MTAHACTCPHRDSWLCVVFRFNIEPDDHAWQNTERCGCGCHSDDKPKAEEPRDGQ